MRRRRPITKWTIRTAACLAAGFVFQTAMAWYGAVNPKALALFPPAPTPLYVRQSIGYGDGNASEWLEPTHTPLITRVVLTASGGASHDAISYDDVTKSIRQWFATGKTDERAPWTVEDLVPDRSTAAGKVDEHAVARARHRLRITFVCAVRTADDVPAAMRSCSTYTVTGLTAGWPARSWAGRELTAASLFQTKFTRTAALAPHVTNSGDIRVRRGSIGRPSWIPASWQAQGFIPTAPLWPGLVANTAFFAAPLLLPMALASTARYAWRRRHHRCTACGYPLAGLTHGPCPECGRHPRSGSRRG